MFNERISKGLHRATYSNFRRKPTKKEVNALLQFYNLNTNNAPTKYVVGAQLKLNLWGE